MFDRTAENLIQKVHKAWGKMVFLSGPRQAGKTTLAKVYQKKYHTSIYFNWDNYDDQKKLLKDPYFFQNLDRNPAEKPLVVFDEIHKYSRWKNYLKGVYDTYASDFDFLITGSGRLDLFKKGGDSLSGRYIPLKLFPLSVGELLGNCTSQNEFLSSWNDPANEACIKDTAGPFDNLWRFSGFPDPLSKKDIGYYFIWQTERKKALLREDVQYLSHVREISQLEMLTHLLPERVGSPLSINGLKEDLGTAFETIRDWISLLENLYYCFRIYPFFVRLHRTLKKEAKLYLYDWNEVSDEGARFENLVAVHLLKAVETWNEMGGKPCQLFYIRDKEKREVDFVVCQAKKPLFLVEAKMRSLNVSPSLIYYQEKLNIPIAFQVVLDEKILRKSRHNGKIQWVCSAGTFLAKLP